MYMNLLSIISTLFTSLDRSYKVSYCKLGTSSSPPRFKRNCDIRFRNRIMEGPRIARPK